MHKVVSAVAVLIALGWGSASRHSVNFGGVKSSFLRMGSRPQDPRGRRR